MSLYKILMKTKSGAAAGWLADEDGKLLQFDNKTAAEETIKEYFPTIPGHLDLTVVEVSA